MTIALSLKINDGVVLAADSATTVFVRTPAGQAGVANIYNNANKVFNLKKGLPIGAVTWGAGNIGNASISTLVKDLRKRFSGEDNQHDDWKLNPENYTVAEVANQFRHFMFDELYMPAFQHEQEKPQLGFVVSGYSAHATMADEYLIQIANGECPEPRLLRQNHETGITWSGMGEALNRLALGFGSALPQVLQNQLGVPPQQIANGMPIIQKFLHWPCVMPAMPLQDAIDLAEFFVDLTIQYARFSPAAPMVGGPIEVAAISKHEGFRWVKRKYYFSRELNPPEEG